MSSTCRSPSGLVPSVPPNTYRLLPTAVQVWLSRAVGGVPFTIGLLHVCFTATRTHPAITFLCTHFISKNSTKPPSFPTLLSFYHHTQNKKSMFKNSLQQCPKTLEYNTEGLHIGFVSVGGSSRRSRRNSHHNQRHGYLVSDTHLCHSHQTHK